MRKKRTTAADEPERPSSTPSAQPEAFPIVGVGASAGGLEAFTELLHNLPQTTGMAFVLVQHLDPTHGSVLREILARTTKIPVIEVTDAMAVKRDHIYVIPPNANMVVERGTLRLVPRTLTRGQHMPINYFFQSMAEELGTRAIGVILSGTASDGAEGCTAIKVAGGITFAQDEASAKYTSMPRSAVNAGGIDFVLPPKLIAQELTRIGKHPYITRMHAEEAELGREMNTLFSLVHRATGVDFTHYKQTTLQRRINRRMVLHKLEKLSDYLAYIKQVPSELDELYRDLLIHVTSFFRDTQAFEALRAIVFPKLLQNRKPTDSPVRIWVPGCSSGEEVYSIAIVLLEYLWEHAATLPLASAAGKEVQIFATDLSEQALDRARSGLYAESSVVEVSPERLKRFFVRLDGGYQINKAIRDMCIFAKQNVANDPPFSNLDLISCRNLLIYLGQTLQKRVIPTLHYALKPDGYLMLGESESLGSYADQFTLIDKKNKIYQKKKTSPLTAARLFTYVTDMDYSSRKSNQSKLGKSETGFTVEKEVERILSSRFVPASIVVNEEMDIVQFRGRTGAYLEPPAGQPTFSLSKMAREGLLIDLRSALSKAKKDSTTVRKEGVRIKSNGGTREIALEVIPVRTPGSSERFYVVVFLDEAVEKGPQARNKGRVQKPTRKETVSARERGLNHEITQLREQLQSLIEERDTTAEEYKSANEEVLSANEELQSTNEELETAKEELQSSNEELTTLNEELHNRNTELSATNNDLVNLLANVNVPVVMIGYDLRIRRFTPSAQKLLNLLPGDVSRRIGEIRPNIDLDDMEKIVRETVDSAIAQEREVRESNGTWYSMRVRPYKTWDNKIDGAVVSFQDIDVFKRTVEETRQYADAVIENAREPILVLSGDLRVTVANRAFYRAFQVTREETEDRLIFELGNGQWDIPKFRKMLGEILPSNSRIDDFEVEHAFPLLGNRVMLLNARRVESQNVRQSILLSIEDITERRKHGEVLRQQTALLELAHDAIVVRNFTGSIEFWNKGAEELYGWKKEEALGKPIYQLLRTEFPKPVAEIEAELVQSGRWEGELVHSTKSGERKIVNSRWALLKESNSPGIVLEINSDITLRKQSEEELRQLSGYLMRVQDEERRRLARELHDSTGQKLVALKMNLETVGKEKAVPPAAKSTLSESSKLLDEATQEIRTLAQLLHPPLLDEAGLVTAIRWLVDGFSARSGITVDLALPDELKRLPQNYELALFRVVQESLINIHRHSGAKKVKVEITQSKDGLTLRIIDDGKGLSVQGADGRKPTLGVGILGMKERLTQLGGKLDVISDNHKGTIIKAVVPTVKAKS
jgi:two-component system CheB/CheR fusion protein